MGIILRVEWSNKDDELLTQDAWPHIHVSAGGTEVPPKPGSSGASGSFPEYEIPDTAQTLRIEFAVIGSLKLQHQGEPRPWRQYRGDISKTRLSIRPGFPVLLWACQEFRVLKSGEAPLEPVDPRSPLMECLAAGSAAGSAAIVHVWTDFLDVTDYVFEFAEEDEKESEKLKIYRSAHQRENAADPGNPLHLTALGFTGGTPKIWFASYCEGRVANFPASEVGTFLYYRPSTDPYSKVCETHTQMIYRNNRYYLAPSDQEFQEGNLEAADRIIAKPSGPGIIRADHWLVRVGMDQALRRCGKPVVMLVPFPHAHDFGRAAGKEMPSLVGAALRFLHGNGEVARNQPNVTLGRLAAGAYSAGGLSFGKMFRQCSQRISELYLFDPTGSWGFADQVIRWGWSTPGACLRISMGVNEKPLNSIFQKTLEFIRNKGAGGAAVNGADNISAWPMFSTGEEFLEAYDRLEWWQYYLSEATAIRPIPPNSLAAANCRHQFAMFGGEQRPITFLEQFLRQSKF